MKKSLHLLLAALLLTVGACNDDPLFEIPPEAPTNVTGAVQGTSATVTWTPGAGATSQEVRMSPIVAVPASAGTALLVEDDRVQTFADNTTNSALFENLTEGTSYATTVTAINGDSRTSSDPIIVQIAGSSNVPAITSVAVATNDPTTVIVEWTAVEGAENYQVSLTADDETGDFQDIATSSATSFPFSPVNPGTTYTAEVCLFTQGAGVGECSATVDYTVPTENTAPVAEITAPADGSEFSDTDIITFAGTGTDAEDGSLTGASLVWTSDVDDELGTGETFELDAALATPGAHVITLTATDSQNAIGQASILIEIVGTPATISFADDILPYFAGSCNTCHGAAALGGIRLDSYTEVSTGSNANGPLIVAGNSADATAILLPQVEADHNNGPDDAAFAVDLAQWIDDGAADN
jgi:hypothetical protein